MCTCGALREFPHNKNDPWRSYEMVHYLIAQVIVNNDSWIPNYAENVHGIVHRHGGK